MPPDARDDHWNRPVARWRQRGAVFLWRYRDNARNYPGWHLTADAAGGASLLALFEALAVAAPATAAR